MVESSVLMNARVRGMCFDELLVFCSKMNMGWFGAYVILMALGGCVRRVYPTSIRNEI